MASYNKVVLVGNLTRDPQLSYLPSNTPVTEFGLAMNRKWRSQDGQNREEVCFVDCRCYGKQAETLNQYMKKGGSLLVDGHLRLDQWESKEGQKRSRLYVIVDNFQFLGSRREGEAPRGGGDRSESGAAPAPAIAEYDGPPAGGAPEDVPF